MKMIVDRREMEGDRAEKNWTKKEATESACGAMRRQILETPERRLLAKAAVWYLCGATSCRGLLKIASAFSSSPSPEPLGYPGTMRVKHVVPLVFPAKRYCPLFKFFCPRGYPRLKVHPHTSLKKINPQGRWNRQEVGSYVSPGFDPSEFPGQTFGGYPRRGNGLPLRQHPLCGRFWRLIGKAPPFPRRGLGADEPAKPV